MDLPGEIRNIVYEKHLTASTVVNLTTRSTTDFDLEGHDAYNAVDDRPVDVGINLLLTCRQIYNEGIDILYGENTFLISPPIPAKTRRICSEDTQTSTPRAVRHHPCSWRYLRESTQKLRSVGQPNRNRMRHVEMELAADPSCNYHFAPMNNWLPNLRSMVLFYFTRRLTWWLHSLPHGTAFQNEVARVLPAAKSIIIDNSRLAFSYAPVTITAFESDVRQIFGGKISELTTVGASRFIAEARESLSRHLEKKQQDKIAADKAEAEAAELQAQADEVKRQADEAQREAKLRQKAAAEAKRREANKAAQQAALQLARKNPRRNSKRAVKKLPAREQARRNPMRTVKNLTISKAK